MRNLAADIIKTANNMKVRQKQLEYFSFRFFYCKTDEHRRESSIAEQQEPKKENETWSDDIGANFL